MTGETLLCLLAGAAAGGFVNGLAGFGTALFALGFFLNVATPVQAVAIVAVISTATGVQGLWVVRRAILDRPRRMLRFLLPGLLGVPPGLMALWVIDALFLKLLIGGFMILYGGYFSLRASLPGFERPTPRIDALIGFLGGVLGGAASLSGALPTMWCSMRPWPRSETRAVLQPYNTAILGTTTMLIALSGGYDRRTMLMLAVALPASMIFSLLGIAVFRRIPDHAFRRLLIGLCFLSGAILLLRELF